MSTDTKLHAFAGLQPLADKLRSLDAELAELAASPDRAIATSARKLRREIQSFEPTMTMIGQVKAGKTTLVNALAGWPGLLPSDVNPWTSVVTSLHMHPGMKPTDRRASFRFFCNEEWDHLTHHGGRVGEIASRAGAEDELEKVRAQLDEMREKSRARLGDRFQLLLGQSHDYDRFDETLIQRYVCLGDDFWEDPSDDTNPDQGRFADITRSADLWFSAPALPVNLCIQDTPGVNDTFLIREQITINALRGSRLCVMMLSAQQALSTVDLGLIRLISNVKSRDLIIFVNRIDELLDPVNDVREIRESIAATLKKFDGPKDVEIIFGSGYWAGHAVADTCHDLGPDSAEALVAWAEANVRNTPPGQTAQEAIWHLSGLPHLGKALSERIETGAGQRLVSRIEAGLANLRTSLTAASGGPHGIASGTICMMSPDEISTAFDRLEIAAHDILSQSSAEILNAFELRAENARQTFLARATTSLMQHLQSQNDDSIWTYDPTGLRILLRSAHSVFLKSARKPTTKMLTYVTAQIGDLYRAAFDLTEAPVLTAPQLPTSPPPVALGQTIALDLRGSWWTRFWRRRKGYEALRDDFARLIDEETAPMVADLIQTNGRGYLDAIENTLSAFIAEQRTILVGLAESHADTSELKEKRA